MARSTKARLQAVLGHLRERSDDEVPGSYVHNFNLHSLSPTYFLPRAATIEPNVSKGGPFEIRLVAADPSHKLNKSDLPYNRDSKELRRTYLETADRARGLAYYLKKHVLKRIGILCPNTPAFFESMFGIPAAGGVFVRECCPIPFSPSLGMRVDSLSPFFFEIKLSIIG